jgi:hypothetical protein
LGSDDVTVEGMGKEQNNQNVIVMLQTTGAKWDNTYVGEKDKAATQT